MMIGLMRQARSRMECTPRLVVAISTSFSTRTATAFHRSPLSRALSLAAKQPLSTNTNTAMNTILESRSGHLARSIPCSISIRTVASSSSAATAEFDRLDTFSRRHIGPTDEEIVEMCKVVGYEDLEHFTKASIPESIRIQNKTRLGPALTETEALESLREIASKNKVFRSYIGMGYADCITPPVILRNIMENPAWYTQVSSFSCYCCFLFPVVHCFKLIINNIPTFFFISTLPINQRSLKAG